MHTFYKVVGEVVPTQSHSTMLCFFKHFFFHSFILARDICESNPCGSFGECTGFAENTQFYCVCTDGNFIINEACPGKQKFLFKDFNINL